MTDTPRVVRFPQARAFLRRAETWLLRAEAENNLLLGVAHGLRSLGTERPGENYLATVEMAGEVVGCALRTPPYKLVLTDLSAGCAEALAGDLAARGEELPAVVGSEAAATAFAEAWARHTGARARPGLRQGIYALERVDWPTRRPPGELRRAGEDDLEQVVRWLEAFQAEAGTFTPQPRREAERGIARGRFFLWIDGGEERSMVGQTGETPHGARIGWVYTPPERRGKGYASIAVAELSQRLLDAGRRFCCLFTDLANPTSNHVYQAVGYRHVADVVDVVFDAGDSSPRGRLES